MKKLFKKLALILPGLLLVASVFTLIGFDGKSNSVEKSDDELKTENINQSVSGWNGSLSVVYSQSAWLDSTASNAITELSGLTEFYVSFYVNVVSGIYEYQLRYQLDATKVAEVTPYAGTFSGLAGCAPDQVSNMFTGNADWDSKLASSMQQVPFDNSTTFAYSAPNINMFGTTGSTNNVTPGKYCLGKAKVKLKAGVDTFSAKNLMFVVSGSDGNKNLPSGDSALDTEIGAGQLSDSIDISGTIKGQTESGTRNYSSTAGTAVNLTVPASTGSSNNATLTIKVADGGTVNSFTGSNITGSNGTYTLAFSSRGQTISGTANVTAQDGTTTGSYTINVKWEQFDEKRLTGITIVQAQGSYTPNFTFTAGNNDNQTVTTTVKVSSTTSSVNITPSVDSTKGATVSVNGNPFTGSAVNLPVSNGTTVQVIVRAEDESTKQYNYTFNVVTSDTSLSNVSLKNGNNASLGNAQYNSGTGQWEVRIPYSTNDNPNNIVSVIATPTKNGNTVSYSPTSLSFNSNQEQTQTMKITVTDKDTGETSEVTLVVTREFGDTDNGINIHVYGTGSTSLSDSELSQTTPSGAKPDNYYYSIKLSDYPKVKFDFTPTSTASTQPKIEFSDNNSTWKEWNQTAAAASYTVAAAGSTYYVKVTPSAGSSAAKVYTIHLMPVDERDTDPTLKELYITYIDAEGNTQTPSEKSNQVFDKTKPGSYTFVVPFNAGAITIHYSQNSVKGKGVFKTNTSSASSNVGVATLAATSITAGSSKQFTYYGLAENDTWSGRYTLTIQRERGSSSAFLNDLKLNGVTVEGFTTSDVDKVYTIIVSRGRQNGSTIGFSYTPCAYATATHPGSSGITGNADGTLSASGTMSFNNGYTSTTITVTSQDGSVIHTYELKVYSADEGHDLSDIQILNHAQSGITTSGGKEIPTNIVHQLNAQGNQLYTEGASPANNPVNLTVPYSVEKVFFNVISSSTYATIEGHGTRNLIPGGVTRVKVQVTSEYGVMNPAAQDTKSIEIIFNITREAADSENKLATFTAESNGTTSTNTNVTFSPTQNAIAVADVDPTATSITVTVTKQSQKSTVSINGDTNDALTLTIPITWPSAQTGTVTFPITVTAEDNSTRTYNVTVSREAIKLNNNNTIDNIRIEGTIPGQSPADYSPVNMLPSSFPHNKIIDGHVNTINVVVTTPTGVGSTVNYEYSIPGGTTQTSSGATLTISNVPVGVTKIIVYATAEDGTNGTRYEINLTKPALSNDASLININVNGVVRPNPSPASSTEFLLPSGTTSAPITITPTDKAAKISVSGTQITQDPTTGVASGTLNLKKGNNVITVTVTPEDGSPATNYQVEIWVEESTELGNLSVTDHTILPNFAPNITTYSLTIPYTTNALEVVYTLPASVDPSLVDVTIAGFVPTNGRYTVNVPKSMSIDVVVKQKNSDPNAGSTTYTINVTKQAASSDNLLLDVFVDGSTVDNFSPTTNDYVILMPYNTSSITFSGIKVSDGATYTPTSTTPGAFTTSLKPGVNKKQIAVTSEAGGAPNIYNFYIICADTDKDIINIEILDAFGNPILDVDGNPFVFNANTTNPADFVVPNTVTTANIKITKNTLYSVLYLNGNEYKHDALNESILVNLTQMGSTNKNTFDIYAISRFLWELNADTTILPRPTQTEINDNTSATYSINIVRADLDNDATLKELHVLINGVDHIANFNPLTETYEVENVGNTGSVTIQAIPTKTTSTVLTIKDKKPDANGNATIVLGDSANNGYLIPVPIIVQAEDGTTKTYEVTLARGPIDVNSDNSIVNIRVFDSNQKEYLTFVAGQTTPFEVNIPVGVNDYTIYVEGINGSVAKIYINSAQLNILPESIDSDDWGTTKTYIIYAESGNGVKGLEYTINVHIAEPDNDKDLIYLEVHGQVLVTSPTDSTGPYEIKVPYEVDNVDLIARASSDKANIRVNNGDPKLHEFTGKQLLTEGYNSIYVEVTAEDGLSKKLYQVYVIRAPKDPELLTLGVNGEKLLDMDGFGTQFDPTVKEYKVNVIYSTEIADIFATSSEPSDTITGTGAKNLLVGENVCVVTITSAAGVSTEYTLYIRRYSASSANADAARAWIEEISQFEKDFSPLQTIGYEYTVPNGIDNLNVHFEAEENKPTSDGLPAATVTYYGDKNLRPGLNNVVVVITAPDGITSKVYVINVTKEAMSYEVSNEKYTDFTIENISTSTDPNNYKVNIGNVKSVDVNFEDLIKNLAEDPDNNPLTVTVLSDVKSNPAEVILSVSDGEVTEIVKLTIESTGNPSTVDVAGLWPLYLILGLILLILIFILICVNRDKFGKIAKKTHDKTDKKNKKEDQQQGA